MNVAHVGKMGNAYKIFIRRSQRTSSLGDVGTDERIIIK
jgi:hypothetical protein